MEIALDSKPLGSLGEHEQVRAALAVQIIRQPPDQNIFTILKHHGHAAVVLPDNVLFEGGAR